MQNKLSVTIGQYSTQGRKADNQDFHGALIPQEPLLRSKGIALAIADGISSSKVSHIASETTVKGFLSDYYCTSEAWSVKTSAQCVLDASNSWLHAQSKRSPFRYEPDKGYVCTFSALIIKTTTAHLFHIGDSRIYKLSQQNIEQLTSDHRLHVSTEQSYLARALGKDAQLELDYSSFQINIGDIFFLATDGVYEYIESTQWPTIVKENNADLNAAAKLIAQAAYDAGSPDNLTIQIVRIDELPKPYSDDINHPALNLPLPPLLEARNEFDGYKIIRELHGSHRSHIYLAEENASHTLVALKIPSIDLRGDPAYLERFQLEEWVARRINSAHVLKPHTAKHKRNYLYFATEFIEGKTLSQWLIDNPKPDLEMVRNIVEQIAKGLQAFHRLEILHQDLRPENVMIDNSGTVKLIDFGATIVAGLVEAYPSIDTNQVLGTAQYSAPEYFLGEGGSARADQFSLAVITYQMLSGKLPYGASAARTRTKNAQRKLKYISVLSEDRPIPSWIDDVLRKALQPDPYQRYEEISEFIYDLRHPNQSYLNKQKPPLIDRNPLIFWKTISFSLLIIVIYLAAKLINR